jgi:DDE superfamily endonuclease
MGNRGLGERRNGPAHAQKNGMTNRKIAYWVMPPAADVECVAHMEAVLDTYEKPYNPNVPVLCMDAQPVPLLKETRVPMAATAKHGQRIDYAYERAGTAALFMCAAPVAGWRAVAVRARKTKRDWAIEMARWLEGRYAACGKGILVCDNLNTHTKGAFSEAFTPERARALVRRLAFGYTPKHGSGLNIAENELSSLTRQCVADRRFGDVASLREETKAGSNDVNATQRGVDWQMKIDDARTKLKSVYPTIKL